MAYIRVAFPSCSKARTCFRTTSEERERERESSFYWTGNGGEKEQGKGERSKPMGSATSLFCKSILGNDFCNLNHRDSAKIKRRGKRIYEEV
jgi:hypothetical protein